ncbi:MAG: class I SAM-dependent methyltransferase [Promethearchaeota archaeon]
MAELPGLETSGAREIADHLKTITGGTVLDVATGKGNFIETLMKTLKTYDSFVGVDIDQDDLAHARKRFQNQTISFLEMNATQLDFEDEFFDTVSIANSLHHLENVPAVLAEIKRVLTPGGHFIVSEMYQDGAQSEAQHTDILEHHWTAKIDRLKGLTHHETLFRRSIVAELEALHFTDLVLLDSSRYVKCLFCEDRFGCENPKSASMIASFIKGVDKTLQSLEPHKRTPELLTEAEALKVRVKETGIANASIVFAIGTK